MPLTRESENLRYAMALLNAALHSPQIPPPSTLVSQCELQVKHELLKLKTQILCHLKKTKNTTERKLEANVLFLSI